LRGFLYAIIKLLVSSTLARDSCEIKKALMIVGAFLLVQGSIPNSALAGGITSDKLNQDGVNAYVATPQSTASTTYTDLSTTKPNITVTVGPSGKVLLSMFAALRHAPW